MFYFLTLNFENHTFKTLTLKLSPKPETIKFQTLNYKSKA
jgi:hypothetical protein